MRRRLALRVRPHPPRGPGARRGRMGPEVGAAFQRRSRATIPFLLDVRLAETVSKTVSGLLRKRNSQILHFDRGITYKNCVLDSFAISACLELSDDCQVTVRSRHNSFPTAACARSRRANDTDGLWEYRVSG
eukprot:gene21552-biopygen5676